MRYGRSEIQIATLAPNDMLIARRRARQEDARLMTLKKRIHTWWHLNHCPACAMRRQLGGMQVVELTPENASDALEKLRSMFNDLGHEPDEGSSHGRH